MEFVSKGKVRYLGPEKREWKNKTTGAVETAWDVVFVDLTSYDKISFRVDVSELGNYPAPGVEGSLEVTYAPNYKGIWYMNKPVFVASAVKSA